MVGHMKNEEVDEARAVGRGKELRSGRRVNELEKQQMIKEGKMRNEW